MKKALFIAGAGVLTGLALLGWYWRAWTGPLPTPVGIAEGDAIRVRVAPGLPLKAVADTLSARGLLPGTRVFLWGARLSGRDRDLKAGLYEISAGTSRRGLLEAMTTGRTVQVKVTVPEGLDAEETAGVLGRALGFDAEAFLMAADSLVADEIPDRVQTEIERAVAGGPRRFRLCEGRLAPDTYLFAEGTRADEAARHLIAIQSSRLDSILSGPRPAVTADLSRHEILTLASIVEAEARLASERRRIAAVYVNRLAAGRRLEADPTVAYLLRKKGQRLYYKDLETDSPYNTYRRVGLPPGPIGNPGRATLAAAARPDTSSRDLFFVSDGAGGHVFSRTAAEHERAVREFRRKRAREASNR